MTFHYVFSLKLKGLSSLALQVGLLALLAYLPLVAQTPASAAPQAGQAQQGQNQKNIVTAVVCQGQHRVPCQTIKTRIFTKPGDTIDRAQIRRDEASLWNLGSFDDVTIESENTPEGIVLHVIVVEKPLIRDIKYNGLKSITESDIADRYKARNVHLEKDSPFDPTVEKHAEDAIKELLAEHGRQYATVKSVLTQSPPASVGLTFNVDEGPKVMVGDITYTGNKVLNQKQLLWSMKELRPIGIPHSPILGEIFSRTYDVAKLNEDLDNVRDAYQNRGYFKAIVPASEPTLHLRTTKSSKVLWWGGHEGRSIDIKIPVYEGERYRIAKIDYIENHVVRNPRALDAILGLKEGDIMDVSKLRKGIDNLKKYYGQFGYINFVPNPDIQANVNTHTVSITMDMQEGKPFYVRRIEFSGNTTTRDKVIRRELQLQEGRQFNNLAWENSLLRLNQLGYFNTLKPEDAVITQDTSGPVGEVDINLKVQEKGKNTVGLNGGVSGIAGDFVGANYSTNNFLGLGETLSVSLQDGQLQRNVTFSFTEPYLRDKPMQLGVSVYYNNFHYDQAKEASLLTGQNLVSYYNSLGSANILDYANSSKGFTIGTSYPRRGKFTRLGLSYGYDVSSIQPFSQEASVLFNSVNYRGFSGPNSLTGIVTSQVTPSMDINTVNSAEFPTAGKELNIAGKFAGIGGNVRLVEPTIQFRYFHKAWKDHVVGFRLWGQYVTGWGGEVPPTFDRFFMGGEDTVRGFDIMAITPIAFIPTESTVQLQDPLNPGAPLFKVVSNPTPSNPNGTTAETFSIKIPTYQIATPGGDTWGVGNFEYRVPIIRRYVTGVFFVDAGEDVLTKQSALRVNQESIGQLETDFDRPFSNQIPLVPGTNTQLRLSTGLELDVIAPVVQAPVRLYFAINPARVDTIIKAPPLYTQADFERSIPPSFLNDADVQNSILFTMKQLQLTPGLPFKEAPHVLRFTISRTF